MSTPQIHRDSTGSPREYRQGRRRLGIFVLVAALVASFGALVPMGAAAAPGVISAAAGFEGDDGNLDNGGDTDWNDFDPVSWAGTAPYRTGSASADGWTFFGLTDAVATTSDTAFSGGVKQDDFCASTKNGKAPNKDDIVRAYLASKTVNDDVILALAWARIPQNSTSASAHVAFEFNQGETPCGNGTGLVEREPGDVLMVYDFEGGNNPPTLKLSRWLETEPAGWVGDWPWDDYTCEVSGSAPTGQNANGCWGHTQELTSSGSAEAKVNFDATVDDDLAPGGSQTLGLVEFGEAIINLTDAGVFSPGQCLALGSVFAVSRSSGSSAQAQMKDLVGPGDLNLTNCGTITVVKQTIPDGSSQSFAFAASKTGGGDVGSPAVTSFNLSDASDTPTPGEVKKILNVQPGEYTIGETVPSGWQFQSVVCVDGTTTLTDGNALDSAAFTFNLAADSDIVCTFTNKQLGSLIVEKVVAGTSTRIDGATFVLDEDGDPATTDDQDVIPGVEGETGLFCIDNLTDFSDDAYNVIETVAPTGYEAVTGSKTATISVGDCSSRTAEETITADVTFENLKITSMTTVPILYPNDSATLSATYGTATGTVTFKLHDDDAADCAGTVLFEQSASVSGDGPYSTTNYPGVNGVTAYAITADGMYYWEVIYSGDSSNKGFTSTCSAEFYDVDLTPDPVS